LNLHPEDECRMDLWNAGILPQHYTDPDDKNLHPDDGGSMEHWNVGILPLHGVTTQKTSTWNITAVNTSETQNVNPIYRRWHPENKDSVSETSALRPTCTRWYRPEKGSTLSVNSVKIRKLLQHGHNTRVANYNYRKDDKHDHGNEFITFSGLKGLQHMTVELLAAWI